MARAVVFPAGLAVLHITASIVTWHWNLPGSLIAQSLFGHGVIAPGEKAVPSVRYMAVRQGITDVAYLQKLREVGKNSPEAQAFLKNAAKRVLVDHAHDRHMPDKVREEAAELIVKILQKKK